MNGLVVDFQNESAEAGFHRASRGVRWFVALVKSHARRNAGGKRAAAVADNGDGCAWHQLGTRGQKAQIVPLAKR